LKDETQYNSDLKLWTLIGDVHHKMFWLRQKELSPLGITASQLRILRVIECLGLKASIAELAKTVNRKVDVISRQTMILEKDGFSKRTKYRPKSRLFKISLTGKSIELLKIAKSSNGMKEVLSVLTMEERQQLELSLNRLSTKLNECTNNQIDDWSP
jgi:DNA-binding MarR family transcriptional regulator